MHNTLRPCPNATRIRRGMRVACRQRGRGNQTLTQRKKFRRIRVHLPIFTMLIKTMSAGILFCTTSVDLQQQPRTKNSTASRSAEETWTPATVSPSRQPACHPNRSEIRSKTRDQPPVKSDTQACCHRPPPTRISMQPCHVYMTQRCLRTWRANATDEAY